MKNKIILFILIISILFISLSAFTSFKTNKVGLYIDEETGVNYLVYAAGYKGGITVRYNSDGSIYCNEVN